MVPYIGASTVLLGHVIDGGTLSTTETKNVHEAVLKALSVAVHDTFVTVAVLKVEPEERVQ